MEEIFESGLIAFSDISLIFSGNSLVATVVTSISDDDRVQDAPCSDPS